MCNIKKIKNKNFLFTYPLLMLGLWSYAYANNPVIIPDANLHLNSTLSQSKNLSFMQTTQFTAQEIAESPVVDLSQLLQQEQSIIRLTNNSGDSTQTALSIRGFGDNAVANSLILVDGFPLINPSLLAPNFNSIPLTDIERIDIFQGSEGTLWGNQAVGGVVNIITKHPKKFFADGIVSLGSYSRNYYNVLIGDKFNNGLFYKVYGLIGQTQNFRDHQQQKDNNIAALGGFDYAHGLVSLNIQSYGSHINFPGGLTEQQFISDPSQASSFNNDTSYRTNLFQLLNKHELNNDWRLETRLYHYQTSGDGFINVPFNRYDATTSFDPRLIGHIKNVKITTGYDGQYSQYKMTNTNVDSKTFAKEHDLYLQTITPVTNTLDLTLGGRGAWQGNKIDETVSEPSVNSINRVFVTEEGLTYHVLPTWSLFLRRDGNFSFPKANEQTWVPENQTTLNVQRGVSYETGTTWSTEKQQAQLSIYRLDLDNEIAFNPTQTTNQPFGAYNNLDPTRRYGMTITEKYQLTNKALLNSQMNYVNARFASGAYSGNLIPAVPAFTGNAGLDYAWTEHWKTSYIWLYTGTRYASNDIQNAGSKLSSYWQNDIAIQYFFKYISISAEALNVFNQSYTAFASYNTTTQTIAYYPAAGRNYLITMKVDI